LPESQRPIARVFPLADHVIVVPRNRVAECLPSDEPHDVIGTAVGVTSEAVYRNDSRVLQPPGDLRLAFEAGPAHRVVGKARLHLLESDFPPQLHVVSHVDVAQPASRKETQDLET